MRALRLIGRGLSDTLEHLLPFTLLTLGWWAGVLLVVTAPAATLSLFAMTDPRRAVDRPEWREARDVARRGFRRGWVLALVTVPVLSVLFANLNYYGRGSSRWDLFVPLWLLLMLLALVIALQAFAIAALTDAPALVALRQSALLVALRPVRAIVVAVVLLLVVAAGTALVVPAVMFVPALVAAVVNRVALDGLGLPIADPLAPTAEREAEERARASSSRFGP